MADAAEGRGQRQGRGRHQAAALSESALAARQRKFRCRQLEVRGQQEVDTWPPPVRAEEAQQPEMAAVLSAERLEVSVDGLTLSPDPEERPGAEGAPLLPPPLPPPSPPGVGRGPGAAGQQPETGEAAAGSAAEEARRLEQRWGFGLEELYGLALRFFKGELPSPPSRAGSGVGPGASRRSSPPSLGRGGPGTPHPGAPGVTTRHLWVTPPGARSECPSPGFPGPAPPLSRSRVEGRALQSIVVRDALFLFLLPYPSLPFPVSAACHTRPRRVLPLSRSGRNPSCVPRIPFLASLGNRRLEDMVTGQCSVAAAEEEARR